MPNKDTSTNEDRFGRPDNTRYSGWSAAAAIAVTIIILGIVFAYTAMH
jgi:hypothetical protein